MQTHRIIATDWQIKAAAAGQLKAIILPLEPQIEEHPDGLFYWPNKAITAWMADNLDQICSYPEFPYKEGDRIYLAEDWTWVEGYTHPDHAKWVQQCPMSQSLFFGAYNGDVDDDAIADGWQPAETMPEEAAVHWYEVTGVKVKKLRDFTYAEMGTTGIYLDCPGIDYPGRESRVVWDDAYPDHPWDSDRWVIVLSMSNPNA